MAVRIYRRHKTVGDIKLDKATAALGDAGLTAELADEIYYLTSLAKFADRFVIPPAHRGASRRDDGVHWRLPRIDRIWLPRKTSPRCLTWMQHTTHRWPICSSTRANILASGPPRFAIFLLSGTPRPPKHWSPLWRRYRRWRCPALQELFTRSFEVQAITTLDIGYVLFGEDYKRGELLANLNREHREAGNNCDVELADHLPNMLRLLGKLTKKELQQEMIQELVAPAVQRMQQEFDPDRLEKKDRFYHKHHKTLLQTNDSCRTLYRHTLDAVYEVLKEDVDLQQQPLVDLTSEFFQSVATEMNIECAGNCPPQPMRGIQWI